MKKLVILILGIYFLICSALAVQVFPLWDCALTIPRLFSWAAAGSCDGSQSPLAATLNQNFILLFPGFFVFMLAWWSLGFAFWILYSIREAVIDLALTSGMNAAVIIFALLAGIFGLLWMYRDEVMELVASTLGALQFSKRQRVGFIRLYEQEKRNLQTVGKVYDWEHMDEDDEGKKGKLAGRPGQKVEKPSAVPPLIPPIVKPGLWARARNKGTQKDNEEIIKAIDQQKRAEAAAKGVYQEMADRIKARAEVVVTGEPIKVKKDGVEIVITRAQKERQEEAKIGDLTRQGQKLEQEVKIGDLQAAKARQANAKKEIRNPSPPPEPDTRSKQQKITDADVQNEKERDGELRKCEEAHKGNPAAIAECQDGVNMRYDDRRAEIRQGKL
jgi:hypothetical protein